MNICFVYKHYPIDNNYDTGIGTYLSDLTSELKKKHQVVIITTSNKLRIINKENLIIYALKYPQFPKESVNFIVHLVNIALTLPRIIKRHKIGIIEFPNWECEGLFFSLFTNRFLKIPTVVRLHTPSAVDHRFLDRPKYFSERVKEFCEKIFVNQSGTHLTTSTNFNAKECKSIYQTKKGINIIPLGTRIKHTYRIPAANHLLNVLYVGRLEKRKGIDILIKAIPKVLAKVKNIRFTIVGRENQNEEWISNLRNTIHFKYLDRVNFLGYINNLNTIDKIYQNSDICVIPSRYESFGITVLEPMSYGKAVVASKTGGIPEIIENYKNGIMVDLDKTNKFASQIINLCVNPTLRKRIGKNSINSCSSQFSLSLLAKNTLDLYETVATKTNLK